MNATQVSLWAASEDPHFMPMTKADLVGAPPHTPLAANISADSLLVTAHQKRVSTTDKMLSLPLPLLHESCAFCYHLLRFSCSQVISILLKVCLLHSHLAARTELFKL